MAVENAPPAAWFLRDPVAHLRQFIGNERTSVGRSVTTGHTPGGCRLIPKQALQPKGSDCRCALALGGGSHPLCAPGMLASATTKIVELSPRENYELFLWYEDGTKGVVDLSSMASRGGFAAWLVSGVFEHANLA